MERAMLPQQRRLAARFAQPTWCDDARWQTWGALLEGKDPLAIARWVEGARKEHPDFLDPGADPVDTQEWLHASSDRGVMALLPTSQGVLVAVETAAAGLNVALIQPPAGVSMEELPGLLENLSRAPEAMARIEAAAALTHASLIAPMQALVVAPSGACVSRWARRCGGFPVRPGARRGAPHGAVHAHAEGPLQTRARSCAGLR
nr:hypothetical protein [Deltaproteobacteria bacterium]